MTKVLNLDTIESTSDKALTFQGVKHSYQPLSVGQFVDQVKEAEVREAAGPVPLSETIEFMIQTIVRAFPTLPEPDLRAMPVDRLKIITNFVNDVDQQDVAEAAATADDVPGEVPGESK